MCEGTYVVAVFHLSSTNKRLQIHLYLTQDELCLIKLVKQSQKTFQFYILYISRLHVYMNVTNKCGNSKMNELVVRVNVVNELYTEINWDIDR